MNYIYDYIRIKANIIHAGFIIIYIHDYCYYMYNIFYCVIFLQLLKKIKIEIFSWALKVLCIEAFRYISPENF